MITVGCGRFKIEQECPKCGSETNLELNNGRFYDEFGYTHLTCKTCLRYFLILTEIGKTSYYELQYRDPNWVKFYE